MHGEVDDMDLVADQPPAHVAEQAVLAVSAARQMQARERELELKAEGPSRCTIELEPVDSAVKLTITHEIDRPESKLITAVSGGRPRILSNLKSLLETGEVAITSHPGHH